MKTFYWICRTFIISFGLFLLFSCKKESADYSYPYVEHEIIYMGIKAGLTSSSSNSAFEAGLNEIMQTWSANQPNSSTEFNFDGFTYDITNLQEITGGIPNNIWDTFWEDIEEYSYSVGSCWAFVHMKIASKGGIGTIYAIYAIVTNDYYGGVSYKAVKGNVSPK